MTSVKIKLGPQILVLTDEHPACKDGTPVLIQGSLILTKDEYVHGPNVVVPARYTNDDTVGGSSVYWPANRIAEHVIGDHADDPVLVDLVGRFWGDLAGARETARRRREMRQQKKPPLV